MYYGTSNHWFGRDVRDNVGAAMHPRKRITAGVSVHIMKHIRPRLEARFLSNCMKPIQGLVVRIKSSEPVLFYDEVYDEVILRIFHLSISLARWPCWSGGVIYRQVLTRSPCHLNTKFWDRAVGVILETSSTAEISHDNLEIMVSRTYISSSTAWPTPSDDFY
jgi:hypothetical protein